MPLGASSSIGRYYFLNNVKMQGWWDPSLGAWVLAIDPRGVWCSFRSMFTCFREALLLSIKSSFILSFNFCKISIIVFCFCRNPNFGLATKAKGLQGCGLRGSLGVTSHTPGSVRKCEGVNPHTPKATPTLGNGVLVDFQNFRERFEGSKLNGLWRSLYHWKDLET